MSKKRKDSIPWAVPAAWGAGYAHSTGILERDTRCPHCEKIVPRGWLLEWEADGCYHCPPRFAAARVIEADREEQPLHGAEFTQVAPGMHEDYYANGTPVSSTGVEYAREVVKALEGLDAKERKGIPMATGLLDYFPLALAEVARCSKVGNDQHQPGEPLRWDRSKSGDEDDALMRHFMQRDSIDSDGVPHRAKVAWRALAGLQKWLEDAEL